MLTRVRPRLVAAGAAVLLLVLAGCGESDNSTADAGGTGDASGEPAASTKPSTAEPSSKPSDDGCPYLTADRVSEVLGSPTVETAGTVNACFFDPKGGDGNGDGPSVLLSRIDVQIDPTEYAAQSRALCEGYVTDVEAGDVAFACMSGLGPQGQLYVGKVLVTVAVSGMSDNAAGIAAAAHLLEEVTIPAAR